MLAYAARMEMQLRCTTWVTRVPSSSHIADSPSRWDHRELLLICPEAQLVSPSCHLTFCSNSTMEVGVGGCCCSLGCHPSRVMPEHVRMLLSSASQVTRLETSMIHPFCRYAKKKAGRSVKCCCGALRVSQVIVVVQLQLVWGLF